jgi:FADH2 O2-dependent halogenase
VTADFDLAIVGSGFAGSLLSMIATRLGRRVRSSSEAEHPRFAIGESAVAAGRRPHRGYSRTAMTCPRVRPFASYGEWRRRYPDIVCGLKRGFTYYQHADGQP